MAKRRAKADTISGLVVRAECEGDRDALVSLQVDHRDDLKAYVAQLGDLRQVTQDALVDTFVGESLPLTRQGIVEMLEAMREELGGPDPSPLEELLVDRIVLCWIAANKADLIVSVQGSASMKERAFQQKVLDRSTRRFLHGCKVLAQVRKLLGGPDLQINVGQQQVNISRKGSDTRSC
jgi:hypothetical protein